MESMFRETILHGATIHDAEFRTTSHQFYAPYNEFGNYPCLICEGLYTEKNGGRMAYPIWLRQISENDKWYPWQRLIIDSVNYPEQRVVNFVVDPHGSSGKSTVCLYLEVMGIAQKVTGFREEHHMMGNIMDMPALIVTGKQ